MTFAHPMVSLQIRREMRRARLTLDHVSDRASLPRARVLSILEGEPPKVEELQAIGIACGRRVSVHADRVSFHPYAPTLSP